MAFRLPTGVWHENGGAFKMIKRRSFLAAFSLPFIFYPSTPFARRPRIPVGAIRWDAWYTPGSPQTAAVSRSLGERRFKDRIPTFGSQCESDRICFPEDIQSEIKTEIDMAADAGLDFWAFVAYERGHPLRRAFEYYLSSNNSSRIKFSLICDAGRFQNKELRLDHAKLIEDPRYQSCRSGKPIYCIMINGLQRDFKSLARDILDFRRSVAEKTGKNLTVLAMYSSKRNLDPTGMEAFDGSAYYSIVCSRSGNSYSALAECAEQTWEQKAQFDALYAPTIMTGWDRSPREMHPVFWEARRNYPGINFGQPTRLEFANHIKSGLAFAQNNSDTPAVFIYAWNEFDEGGWLYPTKGDKFDRLATLRSLLL
ncbi:glycoside hydrolase family 99-like domain-containing protein [Sphingobium soli]|uniref:Glycoside hydrolase family 99-like domain-containing protein n=1 Tax=Sphingobium soli TaxID=1591116 RepID=A0ABS8H7D3_9SPHN|nr:glycoside hydrolase family 99-like domain-containing protein [Sphingobium soli]MCC4234466.1 glycoside hydrolase family 99-like domain-containing protein [Sphingobium soli]